MPGNALPKELRGRHASPSPQRWIAGDPPPFRRSPEPGGHAGLGMMFALLVGAGGLAPACLAEDGGGPPQEMPQVDCAAIAQVPNSPMTVESCRQMMAAAQAFSRAAKDERGARAGDEAMSCADIEREMASLSGVGLSENARRENAQAARAYQQQVAGQMQEAAAAGASATVAVTTAHAADAATTLATGGLVNLGLARATQQSALQASRTMGERMAEERKPQEERLYQAVTQSSTTMAAQLEANPRYARLVQLAGMRECQGEPDDEESVLAPGKLAPPLR